MTRPCWDSVNPDAIPASATTVMAYRDGANQGVVDAWARATGPGGRFEHAEVVEIVVLASTNRGDLLDVERGDAEPGQAPGWVSMRRRAGCWWAAVYCSQSAEAAVRAAFDGAGVGRPRIFRAAYNGDPAIPPGYAGHQYANAPMTGGNYDLSSVADDWPRPREEDWMATISDDEKAMLLKGAAAAIRVDSEVHNTVRPQVDFLTSQQQPAYKALKDELDKIDAEVQAGQHAGSDPTAVAQAVVDRIRAKFDQP